MMDHIFLSYSHKDKKYARKLARALESEGFQVWIDDRIDYGTEWPQALQKNLDACSAFIVLMTSNSFKSKWVQNELTRALDQRKPVFPLLLEGNSTWLQVQSTHYADVRSGKLPPARFYELLSEVVRKEIVQEPGVPDQDKINPFSLSNNSVQHGRYIIGEGLAYGDIIALYKSWDPMLQRDVLVGVNYIPHTEEPTSEMHRSAVKYVGMKHPNMPEVIDFFFEDGKQFIVLKYDESREFSKIVKVIEGLIL